VQSISGDQPYPEATRIAGVLQKPDMHKLRANALQHEGKDCAVSWIKDQCQFHLGVRQRTGLLTWKLFYSKGSNSLLLLQSSDSVVEHLFEQVVTKTNEVVKAEKKHAGTKSAANTPQMSDHEISSAFRTQVSDVDWINALVEHRTPTGEPDTARCSLLTRAFLHETFSYITGLAQLYNKQIGEEGPTVMLTDLGDVEERVGELQNTRSFTRWRASTNHWSLCARAAGDTFELFLIHAVDAILLSAAEHDVQREMKLRCTLNKGAVAWWGGKLPMTAEEMRLQMKAAFAKLVTRTVADIDEQRTGKRPGGSALPEESEKQLLAQKIINQQEQLQRQIARDLHDAVIADITVLKRALTGESEKDVSKEETVRSLDEITTRLREICYDLSPTDLRDWGLRTTLEALVEQASGRSTAHCIFECPSDLPDLDGSIDLHIFRILQESLNNSVKYAKATEISIIVAYTDGELLFTIQDNGKGIDFTAAMKQARQGGTGMSGMQERVGIIRSYYPATLSVRSKPGRGTTTKLLIQLPPETIPQPSKKPPADERSALEMLAADE
jgi:signal transduction histidine kinase